MTQLHLDGAWSAELTGLTFPSFGGGDPVTEGARPTQSLGSRVLVLLVYGGFVLEQSQAQVAAPAPWETHTQRQHQQTWTHEDFEDLFVKQNSEEDAL